VPTPGQHSIEQVSEFMGVSPDRIAKTLIVLGDDEEAPLVALVLRGDHELNDIKAEKLHGVAAPLSFASEAQVSETLGCSVGSIGPVGLKIPVIVDRSAAHLADFVCGANRDGFHLSGVNWERDCPIDETADLRNVVPGDPSPDGKGTLEIKRGIEVGHIFQLGTKYSEAMGASVLNEEGREQVMIMGCYGIGVSRVVAAAIEQNHDDKGIIWPDALAPFQVALVPINMHKSDAVRETCEKLYSELRDAGMDVLFMDEEKARLGVMLADVELIGIPHRIVVGDRGLAEGEVEYCQRRDGENRNIPLNDLTEFLKEAIG